MPLAFSESAFPACFASTSPESLEGRARPIEPRKLATQVPPTPADTAVDTDSPRSAMEERTRFCVARRARRWMRRAPRRLAGTRIELLDGSTPFPARSLYHVRKLVCAHRSHGRFAPVRASPDKPGLAKKFVALLAKLLPSGVLHAHRIPPGRTLSSVRRRINRAEKQASLSRLRLSALPAAPF